jgi:MtN3 and saliva related transmembrane protein
MLLAAVGFVAFFTSTISLVPQMYRTFTTKSVDDLSLLMLVNFVIGSIAWVIYGIMTDTFSVWFTNILWAICSVIMLWFKIRYSAK